MWNILSKNGIERCTVDKLEYNGEWMGDVYVTTSVKSNEPIDFEIGDYLMYRGEPFELNYDPTELKKAAKNTTGDAFTYNDIRFNWLGDELTRCAFLDVVLEDNEIHYTALPKFSFFAASIQDLADRIQANLNRIYTGDKKWTIVVHPEYVDTTNVNIDVQNISVWGALELCVSKFKAYFIVRGRTITIGTAGIPMENVFKFGRGKGLYEIEKTSETDQTIITRLRAYGSDKNLPAHYYANVGKKFFATIANIEEFFYKNGKYYIELFITDLTFKSKYFSRKSDIIVKNYDIQDIETTYTVDIITEIDGRQIHVVGDVFDDDANGIFIRIGAFLDYSGNLTPGLRNYTDGSPQNYTDDFAHFYLNISNDLIGTKLYFTSGIYQSEYPANLTEYNEVGIPNNMSVMNLMLPGFPYKSLKDENLTDTDFDYSDDPLDPYVDSTNAKILGIREATVFFDGSNDLEDIYPSIEGMTAQALRDAGIIVHLPSGDNGNLDEIADAEQATDDGLWNDLEDGDEIPTFTITLKDIGFDINAHLTTSSPTISMKDGICGGREFEILKCELQGDNYILTCNRLKDDDIGMYYPNKYYNIKSGDKFVLLNIVMPEVYVIATAWDKLLPASKKYLKKNDYVRHSYSPNVDEIYMARQHDEAVASGWQLGMDDATVETKGIIKSLHDTIKEGDIMLFEDSDLGINGSIIIDSLVINEGDKAIPTYTITLRNEKTIGSLQRIQNQIDSIVNGGQGSGGYTTQQIEAIIKSFVKQYCLSKVANDETPYSLTMNELLVRTVARLMRTISDEISSESFTGDGFLGEGFKLWMNDEGLAELTVDKLIVRQLMTVFEMLIQKVYSVGGELIVSAAKGKIKTVEEVVHEASGMDCYYITFENDNEFLEWDLVRCQVFNSDGTGRGYWVPVYGVESADGGGIYLPISGFNAGVYPQEGDELVLMGNAQNAARQNLISISATEDGKPRIDILSGVNTTSLAGCLRVRLGDLSGITDSTLGDLSGITDSTLGDLSGQGLFADNCYLKGTFHFRNGKNAEDAISKAQEQADQAKTDAETANNKLADIADDNKLTAGEQPEVLREWLEIKAEYYGYLSQANNYGISTSSIETAYDSLSCYIDSLFPEEVPTKTTLEIDGAELRGMFANYYRARQNLLDAIATGVKSDSDKALEQLSKIADDGWLTQGEQPEVLREIEAIKSEYSGYESQVHVQDGIYTEITTTFDTYEYAYTELINYVTTLFGGKLVQSSSDIEIDASEFNGKFKSYYDARKNWIQAMSEEQKRLSESYTDTKMAALEDSIELSVTEIRNELESANAQIDINSQAIDSKVSQTEYDENNNTINEKFSQIEQTADSISLTVDGFTVARDGSYNLLNTSFAEPMAVIDSQHNFYIRESALADIKGKTLCFSVYATGENVQAGILGVQARIGYDDGTAAYQNATINNRGNFEDVQIEFPFTTDETKNVTELRLYPLFRNGTVAGELYFAKPQLEIGVTPFRWRMPISDKTSRNLLANTSATGVISPIGNSLNKTTVTDNDINIGDWLVASSYLELKNAKAHQIGVEMNVVYTDDSQTWVNRTFSIHKETTATMFVSICFKADKAVKEVNVHTIFRQGSGTIAPSGEVFTSKQKLEIGKVASQWISATEDVTSGLTQKLLATGINITKEEITVTAPKFLVQGNDGTPPIAVFKVDETTGNPVLQAPYIDVENLEVKKLNGVTGTFNQLKCAPYTDDSGNEVNTPAEIVLNTTYGSIDIQNGDIRHIGKQQEKNDFGEEFEHNVRFYAQDMWVGGSFGAHKRVTMALENDTEGNASIRANVIADGIIKDFSYTTLTRKYNSGTSTYYFTVPINNALDKYPGLHIDTVIIAEHNTATFDFNLDSHQRLFVLNASDESIKIASNGSDITLDSGRAAFVVNVGLYNDYAGYTTTLGYGNKVFKLPTN